MEAFALSPDAVRVPIPQRLLSDDRLLRLVAAGNAQAFGAVYARYHAPLYAYCRSIVRDPDDAKDALQNTMVKALAALGRGEDRELPLKPWLFRIAHNESITLLRRRRPSEPLTDAVSPPVAGVDTQVLARERLAQLVEDLRELPERQRSALIMREVNGLGYDEIAGALDISQGAARQTVFEARGALAEYGEGREVACQSIRRSISDGDGRAMRARRVRAHLRSCDACREFQVAMKVRRRQLAILVPGLSGGSVAALLQGVLGAGAAGSGVAGATGGAGLLGGSAAGALASGAAKGVVALVAVSAVGAGAVHLTAPARHSHPSAPAAAEPVATSATSTARPVAAASHHEATASLRVSGFSVAPAHRTAVARKHAATTVHKPARSQRRVHDERQGDSGGSQPAWEGNGYGSGDGSRGDGYGGGNGSGSPPPRNGSGNGNGNGEGYASGEGQATSHRAPPPRADNTGEAPAYGGGNQPAAPRPVRDHVNAPEVPPLSGSSNPPSVVSSDGTVTPTTDASGS